MTASRARYVDRRREIAGQLREIDEIVLRAESEVDLTVRNYLAKFAVVRLSGTLEFSLENMMVGFLEENSSSRTLSFATSNARKISNLNPNKLENLLGSFDSAWKLQFQDFLDIDERRQNLGNLIGARHSLAHGKSTSVSTALLRTYHKVSDETINHLLGLFLPIPTPTSGRGR